MEEKKLLEEKYKYVEGKRNIGDWVKKRMSWLILIVASILFIFKEGLEFSASTDDVLTIIMSMSFTYLFALYVSISLRQMGKKSGKESQTFMNALKYLAEAKTNIKEIMYLLPRYARYKNEVALNDVRKLFIEEMGLLFTLYQKGYYERKEIYKSLSIEQKKALEDVKKIKITKLQPSDLLSEHSKSKSKHYDPLYLGKDERTDARQSSITMAITKSILPIITSYFAIQVVLGSSILWGAIQVAVIMLMGVTHYMEGEDYIVSELKNRQINKADLLIEFKNLYDNSHQIFQEEIKILEELEKEEQKSSPPIIESGEMPLQLKEA
jgi:hypothetical protein